MASWCITNDVLMAGGALAHGVPTPIVNGGLRTLTDQTRCGNIVNWNMKMLSDSRDVARILDVTIKSTGK